MKNKQEYWRKREKNYILKEMKKESLDKLRKFVHLLEINSGG